MAYISNVVLGSVSGSSSLMPACSCLRWMTSFGLEGQPACNLDCATLYSFLSRTASRLGRRAHPALLPWSLEIKTPSVSSSCPGVYSISQDLDLETFDNLDLHWNNSPVLYWYNKITLSTQKLASPPQYQRDSCMLAAVASPGFHLELQFTATQPT